MQSNKASNEERTEITTLKKKKTLCVEVVLRRSSQNFDIPDCSMRWYVILLHTLVLHQGQQSPFPMLKLQIHLILKSYVSN